MAAATAAKFAAEALSFTILIFVVYAISEDSLRICL
jgi:hypothetical protein